MPRSDIDSPGPSWDIFRWVKVGPGVVGRTVPVAVCLVGLLSLAIWKLTDPMYILTVVAVAVLSIGGYFATAFWYANKHPDFSVLDGGTLVDYRKAQLAARDPGIIEIDTKIVPNISNPRLENSTGGEDV